MEYIKAGERLDDLERSGLKIIQNPSTFCFGMDAVLLSSFIHLKKRDKMLDLGTGTGIIPILMSAKSECQNMIGLEIQSEMVDMARRSIAYNHLEDRIQIQCADLRDGRKLFTHASFDVVVSNPPYMNITGGIKNSHSTLAVARHEICATLEDIIEIAAYVLKSNGYFYMVHRPHRLTQIMKTLEKYKLEIKRMCFVHPYIDKEANMVLMEARKGGGCFLKLEPPIVVYDKPGVYTKEIYQRYGY